MLGISFRRFLRSREFPQYIIFVNKERFPSGAQRGAYTKSQVRDLLKQGIGENVEIYKRVWKIRVNIS